MTDPSIVVQLRFWPDGQWPAKTPEKTSDLYACWRDPDLQPAFVRDCPVTQRLLALLGPLNWSAFPERDLRPLWRYPTVPWSSLAAAELIRLNEAKPAMESLHQLLIEHPALIWLLGFPRVPAPNHPLGFNVAASLPTARHLTHMLRTLPNTSLQFLLADSVRLILAELAAAQVPPVECISLDTKHIVAWVKENNPKAYIRQRFNKTRQPAGDRDCRLGCKRQRNQPPPEGTPSRNPVPARGHSVGEFYWGYGSGIVVTKVPELGEFVLAELTQPFDQGDVTYFFPLMRQTQERLGYRPRFGAFDAAFDAWYVYAYFYRENDLVGGFAAVPFAAKGGYRANGRRFSPDGLPLCAAGLPMPLRQRFTDRTSCLIEHERGQYVCPLRFPDRTARSCPAHHTNWKKGGCTAMMPLSIGARLRYTLDREGEPYKTIDRQRTAVERINSQALALGIEHPHLRNGAAIANQNTLIYVLINLRFLQRLRDRQPPA